MLNWEWLFCGISEPFFYAVADAFFRVSRQYWCDNEQKDAFCFEITFFIVYLQRNILKNNF